ncbi:peroxisomal carnitine O-octanoyltransferase-like isoform X1 [Styela clava]
MIAGTILRRHCTSKTILFWRNLVSVFNAQQMKMESAFIEKDPDPTKRTFGQDDKLPSLPLPKLNETIQKYMDSCKAAVTKEDFVNTQQISENFVKNEGVQLHKSLLERSQVRRNWMDEWWTDAYLKFRGVSGNLNFTGIPVFCFWPVDASDQLKSAAWQLHFVMKYWSLLREEKLKQQKDRKGNNFSMYQFRFLFNTCRIPYKETDELFNCFKTIYEGDCPTHVIIFYHKRIYKIASISNKTGQIYTPSQFYKVVSQIVQDKESGEGISTLTELDRDTWADARSHLIELSPQNKKNIHDIDTALFCFNLSDDSPQSDTDLLRCGATLSYGNRWMDKFNYICTKNGKFVVHADHTPLDGMVFVTMMAYIEAVLQDMKKQKLLELWNADQSPVDSPVELTFVVNEKLKSWIEEASKIAENLNLNFDCNFFNFQQFGKKALKKLKNFFQIHPCGFVQICIQLAYMRKHGHPAPTYETATTRIFYRGRTETIRTCTPEVVEFCEAMISDLPNTKELFMKACKKYVWLMEECKAGRGCDRYMLGIAAIANENGEKLPEIFSDSSFEKSGGNGNFILSTSFSGYANAAGSAMPMRDDGYGAFYKINDDHMTFVITAMRSGPETDAKDMALHIGKALQDVYDLMVDYYPNL